MKCTVFTPRRTIELHVTSLSPVIVFMSDFVCLSCALCASMTAKPGISGRRVPHLLQGNTMVYVIGVDGVLWVLLQESRRKAQEELAGANKAEKAAQKTVATLEKDLAAAASKVTFWSHGL